VTSKVLPKQRSLSDLSFYAERVDLTVAFRWAARLNLHESVANHFSLAVSADGSKFLMNPNQVHFSLLKASSLLLIDANDPATLDRPDAPDRTAWGLHGAIHRHLPHARCLMHVHSTYATVLASLADSRLLPIDQNSAMFFDRYVIDEGYAGLALEHEGERCARLLSNPKHKVMIMGNHGVLVTGKSVADSFNRLYYFERAAQTYIMAMQTGKSLRILSDDVAAKVAQELEEYPDTAERHLADLKTLLQCQEPDFIQ
jgi:ribulose-5-phosphate 4-epimerase/fuculose-1-phosphate aldolase